MPIHCSTTTTIGQRKRAYFASQTVGIGSTAVERYNLDLWMNQSKSSSSKEKPLNSRATNEFISLFASLGCIPCLRTNKSQTRWRFLWFRLPDEKAWLVMEPMGIPIEETLKACLNATQKTFHVTFICSWNGRMDRVGRANIFFYKKESNMFKMFLLFLLYGTVCAACCCDGGVYADHPALAQLIASRWIVSSVVISIYCFILFCVCTVCHRESMDWCWFDPNDD